MIEKDFNDGLIGMARYNNYEKKEELLGLLKKTYITFNKTNIFTKKSWQCYEDVQIRIAPEYKAELEKHKEVLCNWCAELYEETEEYDLRNVEILVGTQLIESTGETDVFFEHQQEKIITEIRQAKYVIWIAVAWFTDERLFDELKEKVEKGVNVQLIIDDDDINRNYGFKYEDYFETHRMPLKGYFDNIVHHKFCVIDLQTSLHGSYNWTRKAQYNRETLEISENREIAQKFADEFIALKTHKVW